MILWDDKAVILFHMVLASVLEWLEGPKCLSQRAGTGAGCWPRAQVGLLSMGRGTPTHGCSAISQQVAKFSEGTLSAHKSRSYKSLQSPALGITPHRFCHIRSVKKGNRGSPDSKGGETDPISWWENSQIICSYLESLIGSHEYLSRR